MKKKVGPLPTWVWLALAAGAIFAYYLHKRHSEEAGGVEEGFFPTQGIPAEGAGEGGGAGGIEAAREAAEHLAEEHREEREEHSEERREGFTERAEARREAFEKWVAQFARAGAREGGGGGGKGGKGGKGKKSGKGSTGGKGDKGHSGAGNKGQKGAGNHSNHQPEHVNKTNHGAASPPRTRNPKQKPLAVPTSGAFGTPKTLGNPSHQAGHGSSKKKAKR